MVAALAFLLAGGPVRSEPFAVGGWSGNSFKDESTGRFAYCAVAAPYSKGDTLSFMLKRGGEFAVGFESAGWAFSPHHNYNVRLRVDRGRTMSVRASAVDRHGLLASIARPEPLFEALRRGRALLIEVNGRSVEFALTGTSRSLELLFTCVATELDQEGGDTDDELIDPNAAGIIGDPIGLAGKPGGPTSLNFGWRRAAALGSLYPALCSPRSRWTWPPTSGAPAAARSAR